MIRKLTSRRSNSFSTATKLRPSGWTKNTLKIGDVVTVEGTPAKDGGHHGNARNVFLASTGQKLGAASSEGQTAAPKGKQ